MDLNGERKAALRKAIISAFPGWGALQIVVDDRLSEQLVNISSPMKNMPEVAHDLIGWALSRGRLTELVIGAAAENPGNPQLRDFAEQFKFVATADGEAERIVMPLVPFENVGQWLERLARLRRAVARFEPQPAGQSKADFGTGFLVAPDLLMTNWHVVEKLLSKANNPKNVVVRFDCEIDGSGLETSGRVCGLADHWECGYSVLIGGFDYALVRLDQAPGNDPVTGGTRGFIKLDGAYQPVAKGPLMIIQHPDAMPLKLSIGTIETIEADGRRVSYTANTMGGSSGSPCFNSALQPVILHNRGSTSENRGVRLDAIHANLKLRNLDGLLG